MGIGTFDPVHKGRCCIRLKREKRQRIRPVFGFYQGVARSRELPEKVLRTVKGGRQ